MHWHIPGRQDLVSDKYYLILYSDKCKTDICLLICSLKNVSRKHGLDSSGNAKHRLWTTTDANLHLVYLNSTRGQHVFNVRGICSIFKPLSDF